MRVTKPIDRRPGIEEKKSHEEIKKILLSRLKSEKAFWSYNEITITIDNISDDMLIANTMRYLDLEEIKMLYSLYTPRRIKQAWKDILIPEGEYLYTLNRFFAWYYFGAKNPGAYVKSLQTRHLNKLLSYEGNLK